MKENKETFEKDVIKSSANNAEEFIEIIPNTEAESFSETTEDEQIEEDVHPEDPSLAGKRVKKRKSKWPWVVLLLSVVMLGLSVFLGYRNGVQRRIQKERSMLMDQISVQLDWVYKDIEAGRYENAKTRLEYIIDKYPGFPGAADLLVEVMMKMEVPTQAPTIPAMVFEETEELEITPTPDSRASEEIFLLVEQLIAAQDWHQALENIQRLKESNYGYKTVEVDGYYFIALRNRGIQRIWAGEIEQGMYDLSIAEQLGAIDSIAAGAKSWGSLYLTGASYWDVNWAGAVDIFGQLYAQMPFFTDSTGMNVTERYRIALYKLGDQFAMNGDYCTASQYYNRSLEVGLNLDIQVTATWLAETCANPSGETTPEPPIDPEETPVAPTEEPTPAP